MKKKTAKKKKITEKIIPVILNPLPEGNESIKKSEVLDEVKDVEKRLNESGVLNADLIQEIKKMVTAEVVLELKEKKVFKEKELEVERELEDIEYRKYVERMYESDDPWIDFVGNIRDTEKGQRLQMEWNSAFITYLRESGITGITEEDVVQKYVTLLLQNMVDREEERYEKDSKFS